MPKFVLLALLAASCALAATEPAVTALDAKRWIVQPGATLDVSATVTGQAGQALIVRAELSTIKGDAVWVQEQTITLDAAKKKLRFAVDTAKQAPGDHSVRVSVRTEPAGKPVAARERALMLALPGDLVILFDQKPEAQGIRFNGTGIRAEQITVEGAQTWVHLLQENSRQGAEGWWRSMLLTLDNEAYRNGQRPIADVQVVYRHTEDAPVELVADTAEGPRTVAKGWGRNPKWQRLSASLGDARFAAPDLDIDPKKRATDGCDLRFNMCNGLGAIRSVRIHAPDARSPQDWSRFLSAASFSSDKGWIVEPGQSDDIAITITNKALGAYKGQLIVERCKANGDVLEKREHQVTIKPGSDLTHTEGFGSDQATGEQLLRWRLVRKGKLDAGWEHSRMVATDDQIFILFEREIIARGIELAPDQNNIRATTVTTHGLERSMWTATHGSAEVGWWNSVKMNVTDERFNNGAMPVADIAMMFRQVSDAPVSISADTAKGGGQVGNSWGGRGPNYAPDPPIKAVTAHLDDAVFGRTEHTGKPDQLLTNGYDLRYNSCSSPALIRSAIVTGYARTKGVDWARMLRKLGEDLGKDRYVFTPGETIQAQIKVANRAAIAWTGTTKVSLSTDLDKVLWSKDLPTELAANSEDGILIPIDTADFPHGVYVLRVNLGGHIETKTFFAVSDNTPLPKAAEGEFLFGMDMGSSSPLQLDWADYMGVDMFRNCGRQGRSLDALTTAITALKERGFRGHLMWDPPWHPDATKRAEMIRDHVARMGAVAETHGDFLHWYELGNEPDLPFFYAGPIDAYMEGYVPLYDVIKSKDPTAVVMNGGLCFHGKAGWDRAHELIRKMPKDKIDAWAYHGHGPGAQAERNAWNRQHKAVSAVGLDGIDYVETESGVTGNDATTLRGQARTIVQKLVFAQSKQMPVFFWFTFGTGTDGRFAWGICENGREPRPAVLAHRAMVQRLRGLHYYGALDLQADQAEAHLFAADDGRRVLVSWSPRGELSRTIAVGPGISDLTAHDLFGNPIAIAEAAPGLVPVAMNADPVWVSWTTSDAAFEVSVPPAPIVLPARLAVVPGREAHLPTTLRNTTAGDITATLSLTTTGETPLRIAEAKQDVVVAANTSNELTVKIPVADVEASIWPRQWTVFAPIKGSIDASTYTSIPSVLSVNNMEYPAAFSSDTGHGLDIAAVAGGHAEKKQALCFASIELDAPRSIEVGASADWWMQWFVNGTEVYSTMSTGNRGGKDLTRHTFTVDLKAGTNIIAVRVLSGSDGWKLFSTGPQGLESERRAKRGERDALRVELHVGANMLAREDIPVTVLTPVDQGSTEHSHLTAPDGLLGNVDNLFMAQPEQSRWYHGDKDLSGRYFVRDTGTELAVIVAVRDDTAKPGDRTIVHLATGADLATRHEFTPNGQRDAASGLTWYEARIPRATIGADRFALRIVVEDDDWGELKQRATSSAEDEPETWLQSWLR
ncbi:MAG: hypothetical protein PF961_04435 [Planctomycetota bacterium]|jgi:hypothetical protein|nr:hypothetical protein [Planctomycetota bacterium]